jgi:hypothetical protein
VILESTEEVVARAQSISTGPGTARARLVGVITHIVSSFYDHYPTLNVFVQEDMRRVRSRDDPHAGAEEQRLAELADLYMATLESLIREGVEAGVFRDLDDPQLTAQIIQGSLNWMHRWFRPGNKSETAHQAQVFVAILLDGLASTPPGDGKASERHRGEMVSP